MGGNLQAGHSIDMRPPTHTLGLPQPTRNHRVPAFRRWLVPGLDQGCARFNLKCLPSQRHGCSSSASLGTVERSWPAGCGHGRMYIIIVSGAPDLLTLRRGSHSHCLVFVAAALACDCPCMHRLALPSISWHDCLLVALSLSCHVHTHHPHPRILSLSNSICASPPASLVRFTRFLPRATGDPALQPGPWATYR